MVRTLRSTPGATRLSHGLATTPEDFDGAFRLVHDEYVARGYMERRASGRRIGLHHALPSTRVFVSRDGAEIIGTVSVISDSLLDLPCDAVYRDELAPLRAAGRHIAEVSAFAVDESRRTARLDVVLALFHLVVVFATRIARIDDLCITVNPRHATFYERALGFQRFGDVTAHPAVAGAPAVGMRLDLRRSVIERDVPDAVRFSHRLLDPLETARVQAALENDLTRSVTIALHHAATAS